MSTTTISPSRTDPSANVLIQALDSFTIPPLPTSSTITSLTLTSDIPVADYHSHLTKPYTIPSIPPTIKSLTLELFAFGYPANYLSTLAERLPNLTSLTLYSQLIAGTTAESFQDATTFFAKLAPKLKELHLIDVFVPPDFYPGIPALAELKVLEASWTFRGEDKEFGTSLPLLSIQNLVQPGLVTLAVAVKPQAEQPGMMPSPAEMGEKILEKLAAEGMGNELKALDLTAFKLSGERFVELAGRAAGLKVVSVAVEHDGSAGVKERLLEGLKKLEAVEKVEVIIVPGMDFYAAMVTDQKTVMDTTLLSREDVQQLTPVLKHLTSIDVEILKVPELGYSKWQKQEGEWKGDVAFGEHMTRREIERVEEIRRDGAAVERVVEIP